ncbi:MAG: hypothetical protein H7839_08655 [Magnetococcus sp. YQC-5]
MTRTVKSNLICGTIAVSDSQRAWFDPNDLACYPQKKDKMMVTMKKTIKIANAIDIAEIFDL